ASLSVPPHGRIAPVPAVSEALRDLSRAAARRARAGFGRPSATGAIGPKRREGAAASVERRPKSGSTGRSSAVSDRPNIVLVHGAWADGSCWSGVIERLQTQGFQVRAPQFPLTSPAAAGPRPRQVLEFQNGPTIVVGHSYGGQIMTALGDEAPNVAGLVYIAAF